MHTLYVGNPGTGKTTVARIMAKIFRALGVIKRGHLVECDRSSLVAGFTGQTAIQTGEKVEESLGGVMFVDEAYALNQGHEDQFGKEAVNTLLKRMEDLRDEFIVIAAGYPENMNEFLDSNPGLRSRFEHTFHFEDYNGEELFKISMSMLLKENLFPTPEADEKLRHFFIELHENKNEKYFGNARDARKIIQQAIRNQHLRMAALLPEQRTEEMMERPEWVDLSDLPKIEKDEKHFTPIGFKTS
jgi:AAA+ superfamily predicted ATPase